MQRERQAMFARMASAMSNIVMALAVAVDDIIIPQSVFRSNLVAPSTQVLDASEQQQRGSLFQPRS